MATRSIQAPASPEQLQSQTRSDNDNHEVAPIVSPTPAPAGGYFTINRTKPLRSAVLGSFPHFVRSFCEFWRLTNQRIFNPHELKPDLSSLTVNDLFRLFKIVESCGGFECLTDDTWAAICNRFPRTENNFAGSLKDAYKVILLPFEKFLAARRLEPRDTAAMASTRSSLREGLRQAPKANQPFIPDTAPVRQARSTAHPSLSNQGTPSGHTSLSHTAAMDSSNILSADFDIDRFEGKDTKQIPMSTRDVLTPGNRPDLFKYTKDPKQPDFYHPYYPLKFADVPRSDDIYKRCLMSIQCGIPDEVDFGLFHLVQISAQKMDKFHFEGFPNLMEALMEKAMDITRLCTGVAWELERDQYDWPNKRQRPNVLNTLLGTHDILTRIQQIPVTLAEDTLETGQYSHDLLNIKEATLILRNMCLVPRNAMHVAFYSKGLIRDFLNVMLNLPQPPRFNELKNDALDIAEAVTRFMPTAPDDPLCISLYNCLKSDDRAHIVGALGALTHFSTELPGIKNRAMEVDIEEDTMTKLITFTLLKADEDLLSGAMDFFYQYTDIPKNVERLAHKVNMPVMFIPRMIDLLSYQSRYIVEETVVQEEKIAPPASTIPKVPPELFRKLMALPEPERSSQWLRCCFVEDPGCEITQIALWQAYQYRFGAAQQGANPQQPNTGALAAADFIKNVSATFTAAQAQVVQATGPGGQPSNKFIIRGIRPLETALTFDKWPYLYCKWSSGDQPGHFCDRAFAEPRELRLHVFVDHLDLDALDEPNQYNLDRAKKSPKACRWGQCAKYRTASNDTEMVVEHVGGHLPQDRPTDASPPTAQRQVLQPRIVRRESYHDTPYDEYGEAVGIAYKAALVMRNLSWHLPDTGHAEKTRGVAWNKYAFTAHRQAIIAKFGSNRTLREVLSELIVNIHGFM